MSKFSIGQMNQLGDALERYGITPEEVTRFSSSSEILQGLLDVIRGRAKVVMFRHIINCNVDPEVPDGWDVVDHIRGSDQFEWDRNRIGLHITRRKRVGGLYHGQPFGDEVQQDLRHRCLRVPNANIVDYLIAHPELVPEEWGADRVMFWGTVYRNPEGRLYVRYITHRIGVKGEKGRGPLNEVVKSGYQEVRDEFGEMRPAAILKDS